MDLKIHKLQYLTEAIEAIKENRPIKNKLFNALSENSDFANYKGVFEDVRKLFVNINDDYGGRPASKLRFYLSELYEFKKNKDRDQFDILKKLIIDLEFHSFTEQHQGVFTNGLDILETRIDFFCSYTTRGLPALNNAYRKAIRNQYGGGGIRINEWGETNYIAKMIVRFFNLQGFNGFFDQENLISGDSIKEEVYGYCRRAVVFVQIMEGASFDTTNNQVNWCLKEFLTYREYVNIRYIFYREEGLDIPLNVSKDTRDWYKFAASTDGVASKIIGSNMTNAQIRNIVNKDAYIISQESEQVFTKFWEAIA